MADAIRVVSINTWKGDGPYVARIEALVEGLRALRPDLLACQETLHAPAVGYSTFEALADGLGMTGAFAPLRRKRRLVEGRAVESWSGLAVLSRWPLIEERTTTLPSHPADGDRGVQFAWFETPLAAALLANAHLTHLDDSNLRRRQVEALLDDEAWSVPASVRLLVGDFNAEPGAPELASLAAQGRRAVDVLAGLEGDARATFSPANPHIGYNAGVSRALDHIYVLGGVTEVCVEEARVVLDAPGSNGILPSDHYGVAATLRGGLRASSGRGAGPRR